MESTEAPDSPLEILEVLRRHREVFPDAMLAGLPPKRPHDHLILLVPGELPAKSAIYRINQTFTNMR